MPKTPDFEAIATRVVNKGNGQALAAQFADELRLMWNARGAADVALLEGEIPNYWTMANLPACSRGR
jgi:hypothetical protein